MSQRGVRMDHLRLATALPRLAACAGQTAVLLGQGRVHVPRDRVGTWVRFADGSTSRVYRETVLDRPAPADQCALIVQFRLRLVCGWGHRLLRAESWLNTPLFVGFPGSCGLGGTGVDACSGRPVGQRRLLERMRAHVDRALSEAGDQATVDRCLALLAERGTGADRQMAQWELDPSRASFTRALARTTLTAPASVRHRDVAVLVDRRGEGEQQRRHERHGEVRRPEPRPERAAASVDEGPGYRSRGGGGQVGSFGPARRGATAMRWVVETTEGGSDGVAVAAPVR